MAVTAIYQGEIPCFQPDQPPTPKGTVMLSLKPGSHAALLGATQMLLSAIDQQRAGELQDLLPFTSQVQALLHKVKEEDAASAEDLRPQFERWMQAWSEATAGAPLDLRQCHDDLLGQTYIDLFVAGAWHVFRQLMLQRSLPLEAHGAASPPQTAQALSEEPASAATYRQPIDANDLERMARERPDECFLKGSGVLKLTDAIRQLEAQLALCTADRDEPMTSAVRAVLAERQRQKAVEGWTPEHDDEHQDGELAVVAGAYAMSCGWPHERDWGHGHLPKHWPLGWNVNWWKPTTKERNLEKAGSLILAELERLHRIAAAQGSGK